MNFLNQTFKRRRVLKILGVSAVGAITGGTLINFFKHKKENKFFPEDSINCYGKDL